MLDVLDALGRRGVETGAVGATMVGCPALVGVEWPDELVAARILLGIAVLALGRSERDSRRRQHAAAVADRRRLEGVGEHVLEVSMERARRPSEVAPLLAEEVDVVAEPASITQPSSEAIGSTKIEVFARSESNTEALPLIH